MRRGDVDGAEMLVVDGIETRCVEWEEQRRKYLNSSPGTELATVKTFAETEARGRFLASR